MPDDEVFEISFAHRKRLFLPLVGASRIPALIEQKRLAHIEVPLDPATQLVLQFAGAIELVNARPLDRDQLSFQIVAKLTELSRVLAGSVFYLLQSVFVQNANNCDRVRRELALRRKLIERQDRGFHSLGTRFVLLDEIVLALLASGM